MSTPSNIENENENIYEDESSLFRKTTETQYRKIPKKIIKQKKTITIKNILTILFLLIVFRLITKSYIFKRIFFFVVYASMKQSEMFVSDEPYIRYFENCRNMKKLYQDYYTTNIIPKLSIIVPVYNREIYIDSLLCSLENQQIKSIEIIFIDDLSKDNSVEVINNYIKKDSRIRLIKNKENKGVFHSRYLGTLYAKGNYIYFIDPDDLVSDILYEAYDLAIKNDLDIVEFDYVQYEDGEYYKINKKITNEEIIKDVDIVKYSIFSEYENDEFDYFHGMIWDKIYKKEVLLNAYENIGDKYLSEHLITWDDSLVTFFIFRNAKSYKYIKKIGYSRYMDTVDSIDLGSRKMVNSTIVNKRFHDIFTYLKIIFEKIDDNKKDKLCVAGIFLILQKRFSEKIVYLTDYFDLVGEVFAMYRSIKFLNYKDRNKIESYYKQFEKTVKKFNN